MTPLQAAGLWFTIFVVLPAVLMLVAFAREKR